MLRLAEESKSVNDESAEIQRGNLKKHILSDPIAERKLGEIRRGDIVDFRNRIIQKGLANSTVNKIVGVLKTIFNEAEYREEIVKNPTSKIGILRERSDSFLQNRIPQSCNLEFPTWRCGQKLRLL